MNVLLVDDQFSVLTSYRSGIDWERIGVDGVYTASNAADAKKIIQTVSIDILLSDIEMPVENGLSLLRWCRGNNYLCECIFLTSHANFSYAQEAIQLGSANYILQPAPCQTIETLIEKTIQKIRQQEKEKAFSNYGKKLSSQGTAIISSILRDIFSDSTGLSEKLPLLNQLGITLSMDTEINLFKVQFLSWKQRPMTYDEWREAIQAEIEAAFSGDPCNVLFSPARDYTIVSLVYGTGKESMSSTQFVSNINKLYLRLEMHMDCTVAIYCAPSGRFSNMGSSIDTIRQQQKDNVLSSSGIYLPKPEQEASGDHFDVATLEQIKQHLVGLNTKGVLEIAKDYLMQLNKKSQLHHNSLLSFYRGFEFAALQAANTLNLSLDSFPTRLINSHSSKQNALTVTTVMVYVQDVVKYFEQSANVADESERYYRQITEYIHNNLDKPLKCADIAQSLYLSAGYLTRIMQKKTGCSLKEYITREKMEAAQEMLKNTMIPISAIAAKVGYDNFSHFSQMYKKLFGITPSEDRSNSV